MIVSRILENKFYILYRRTIPKNTICIRYVIYRTNEFGGGIFKEFEYLAEAKRIFNKITKQGILYAKSINL